MQTETTTEENSAPSTRGKRRQTLTQSKVVEKFHIGLDNVEHPEIKPRMETAVGYDDEALAADRDLLGQTVQARGVQQQQHAEARATHKVEERAEKALRSAFVFLHKLIRYADRLNKELDIKSILQTKSLPMAETALLDYCTSLLDRMEANADVMAAMVQVRVDADRITELRNLLSVMRQANVDQAQEQGEAEQATAIFDALLGQLRIAYAMFIASAQEALSDEPQLLELLGISA